MMAMSMAIGWMVYKAGNTQPQAASIPHIVAHIPAKCRQQAFDITQGQMTANLPMMQARELEDLATKCGGWIEQGK